MWLFSKGLFRTLSVVGTMVCRARNLAAAFASRINRLFWLVSLCGAAFVAGAAEPEPGAPTASSWVVQAGGYIHYSSDEDYEGPPWFLGVEYHRPTKWLFGLSAFNNSFGQFTQYAYVGRFFYPSKKYPDFYIKLTGGVAHGYSDEHHKTLPIRWDNSWGLAVIPTVGYKWDPFSLDVAVLSASGLLFLVGYEF